MKIAWVRLLACFIAAGFAGAAAAQTKMVLGYTAGNPTMGAFVAKDQGFFAKRGLDVTLQFTPVGSTIPGALESNSLQVGTLTFPVFLLANEGGVAMQAVAGMAIISDKTPVTGVASRAGSGIKKPADFVGKRIATPGLNGNLHVTFMMWLKRAGVDPKSPIYVEAAFPQMPDMMKGGQVDAALLVEPFLKRSIDTKAGDFVAHHPAEVMNGRMEVFYAMSKKFADANHNAVAAFRDAIREGHDWIAKNTQAARLTQITYLKLPEAVAKTIPLPTFQAEVSAADVQAWIDTCREFGITKGTATVKQVLWQP